MRSKRFSKAAVGGVAVLSLVLSACGGGTDDGDGGDGIKGAEGVEAAFDAASEGVVNKSDKAGGTLKFGIIDDLDSTDPGDTYMAAGNNFIRLYSRMLMTYCSKPGEAGLEPCPDIAAGPGEATDGNKTWTYKLKKGLKYENGEEIKAEHIKYAVARTFDRGVLRNGPSYFTQMLDAEGYKGPYKQKNLDDFKGIETPDDYTIVFKLKEAFPEFDQLVMFSGQTTPIPQDADKGAKYREHPLSSGPYKFEGNYKPGKGGTLVKNDEWAADTDPNRSQLPDKITLTAGMKQEEIDNQLLDGDLHVDLSGKGVAEAARQTILTDPENKKNADNPYAGFHWYVGINTEVVPNVECRKAIIYAANRDGMWRAFGGEVGGEMAHAITPPDIPGSEKHDDLYPAKPGFKGDPVKAKEALKKCGKPDGFPVNLAFRSDRPAEKLVAEALEESLGKVGITVSIKGSPTATHNNEQWGSPSFQKKNKLALGTYGWAPDWPTGYGFLQPLTDGKAIVDTGNANSSNLDDPEINKLWNEVVNETDQAKREEIYTAIDRKVLEQAAILPNVYAKSLLFRPPTLTNVYFHSGLSSYDYANLGVDESAG